MMGLSKDATSSLTVQKQQDLTMAATDRQMPISNLKKVAYSSSALKSNSSLDREPSGSSNSVNDEKIHKVGFKRRLSTR